MENNSTTADREIVITRMFDAPRELVWRAWTTPEQFARWFSGRPEIHVRVLELDVRVGGRFRFMFFRDDGSTGKGEYTGTYLIVEHPEILMFDVIDYSFDPAGVKATFKVELTIAGKQTRLTLSAAMPDESEPDVAGLESAIKAWNACFDRLGELLNKQPNKN